MIKTLTSTTTDTIYLQLCVNTCVEWSYDWLLRQLELLDNQRSQNSVVTCSINTCESCSTCSPNTSSLIISFKKLGYWGPITANSWCDFTTWKDLFSVKQQLRFFQDVKCTCAAITQRHRNSWDSPDLCRPTRWSSH